ncbi:TrkH family potassium uptake protein [Nitrospira sp. Ecomares 2.1]
MNKAIERGMHYGNNPYSIGAIGHDVGLLLQVPGAMAFLSVAIVLGSGEWTMLPGFLLTGVLGIGSGQFLLWSCQPCGPTAPYQAMITVALGWLLIALLGAIPLFVAAHLDTSLSNSMQVFRWPLNALFESMSGFTSTGLTMAQDPSTLPMSIQWWRTFTQWIGGVGVIVLALALFDPTEEDDSLYDAETRSTQFGESIQETARRIWAIFFGYTAFAIGTFSLSGMPIWESVNHGMTGIATGGFTITSNSFRDYDVTVKSVAIMITLLGAVNFVTHHALLVERRPSTVVRQSQFRAFIFLLAVGVIFLIILEVSRDLPPAFIDKIFQWTSALGTCGFSSVDLASWSQAALLFLTMGMLTGGMAGSTTGGLKLKRVIWLWKGVRWRLESLWLREDQTAQFRYDGKEVTDRHAMRHVGFAGILAFLYGLTLVTGALLLFLILGDGYILSDILFETASALGSVGLSVGITRPDLPAAAKGTLIFLMWLGRLEIIAVIILLTLPFVRVFRNRSGS